MAKKIDILFRDMAARTVGPNVKRKMFNAYTWYKRRTTKLMKVDRKGLLKNEDFVKRARPRIGAMYHYFYDPKTKATLPYYDRFPLILMVGPAKGGFYGLNLHYLSPKLRAILLDEIAKVAKTKTIGKTKRLQLTYQILQGSSKLAAFKPCLKHYLNKHLVTPPKEIPYEDWQKVLFLPTESFVGSSKAAVWKDSLRQI